MNKKIERIEALLEDYGFNNKDYTISQHGPTLLFAKSGQIKLKKIKVCRLVIPICLICVGSHKYIFSNVYNLYKIWLYLLYNLKTESMYSLDCNYYTKEFSTLDDLLEDIVTNGMDPNYEITNNGQLTGEMAIDLIEF
jgi:hypothetical protein